MNINGPIMNINEPDPYMNIIATSILH